MSGDWWRSTVAGRTAAVVPAPRRLPAGAPQGAAGPRQRSNGPSPAFRRCGTRAVSGGCSAAAPWQDRVGITPSARVGAGVLFYRILLNRITQDFCATHRTPLRSGLTCGHAPVGHTDGGRRPLDGPPTRNDRPLERIVPGPILRCVSPGAAGPRAPFAIRAPLPTAPRRPARSRGGSVCPPPRQNRRPHELHRRHGEHHLRARR